MDSLSFPYATPGSIQQALDMAEVPAVLQSLLARITKLEHDGGGVPVGTICAFPTANLATGWLRLSGVKYDTAVYSQLFSILGTDTLPLFDGQYVKGASAAISPLTTVPWQMVEHTHGTSPHTHERGTMEITGTTVAGWEWPSCKWMNTGAFTDGGTQATDINTAVGHTGGSSYTGTTLTASKGWTGATTAESPITTGIRESFKTGGTPEVNHVTVVWAIKAANILDDVTNTPMSKIVASNTTMMQSVQTDVKNMMVKAEDTNSQIAVLSNPNILDNGGLQVWQRGDKFTDITGSCKIMDRWTTCPMVGGYSVSHIHENASLGKPGDRARYDITKDHEDIFQSQWIENPGVYTGKQLTFSCTLNTNLDVMNGAAPTVVGMMLTNGYRDAPARASLKYEAVEGVPNAYTATATFTMPTIPAVTSSTYDVQYFQISVYNLPAGSWLEYGEYKLEVGTEPTPFQYTSYAEDLDKCRRYYQTGAVSGPIVGPYAGGCTAVTPMTCVPTIQFGHSPNIMDGKAALCGSNTSSFKGNACYLNSENNLFIVDQALSSPSGSVWQVFFRLNTGY